MKLGISSMAWDLDSKIYICKEIGFDHIEVGIDCEDDFEFIYSNLEKIKKQDISVGIHLPMEINTCEVVEDIRNCWVDFVINLYNKGKGIDIKYYNLHLGYGMAHKVLKHRETYLKNSLCFFNKILKYINSTDIYVENTYSKNGELVNIGNDYKDFKYIFDNISSEKFGFCYDSGHDLINQSHYLQSLSYCTRLIHLSDNDGKEDLHLGLSENGLLGEEKIREILNLRSVKYVILEMNEKYFKDSKKIINKTSAKKTK
ncbi:sugar phosphate isomerase/epimerase family protein [Alkalithermobacter paradoxus]|uniref:Endonuclease 4 n=1 Tax=Alkalithermobacter paradoxus TaxID=29349 RepID=A0A1V4I863_9FIRM|nr:endonuclease 4 [[Clostridium] thermoalcaliphilum]